MTRQVALGAIVAFAVTVAALSMCQPAAKPPEPTAPALLQPLESKQPLRMVPAGQLKQGVIAHDVLVRPKWVIDAGTP